MVRKRFSFPTITDNSLLVAAGIFFSRIAGLLREITIAAFLGNGPALEAFTAAFRIPNTMQNLLGEGVLSASFIPSYSQLVREKREDEAAVVASSILTLLIGITGVLVLVGIFAAEPLTDLIASGYSGTRRELTITLIRITTPGIGLLVISSWCLGVLNSHKQFFLSYVAPVVWNLSQIIVVAFAGMFLFTSANSTDFNQDAISLVTWLGWATVLGAALQLAIQLPQVIALQKHLRLGYFSPNTTVKSIIKRFLPVVGARGVVQVSAWLDLVLASFLAVGAVAALRYASFLYLLPISLFGMSIAAAELPELSGTTLIAIRQRVTKYSRRIAYFVAPIAVAYMTVGYVLVGMLFERGEFSSHTTTVVWFVLGVYAFGLIPSALSRLLQSALYGLKNTTTPARASVTRVVVSVLVGLVLMVQFDQLAVTANVAVEQLGPIPTYTFLPETIRENAGQMRLGAVGLAFGAALGAWVEFWLLSQALFRKVGKLPIGGGAGYAIYYGCVAAVLVAAISRRLLVMVVGYPLVIGMVIFPLAGIAYLVVTKLLGSPFYLVVQQGPSTDGPAALPSAGLANQPNTHSPAGLAGTALPVESHAQTQGDFGRQAGHVQPHIQQAYHVPQSQLLVIPKPPLHLQQPLIHHAYTHRVNLRLASLSPQQLAAHYFLYVDPQFHPPPTAIKLFIPQSYMPD